jgi:hypothetical protein
MAMTGSGASSQAPPGGVAPEGRFKLSHHHYDGPLGPAEITDNEALTVTRLTGPQLPEAMVEWGRNRDRKKEKPRPLVAGVGARIGETEFRLTRPEYAWRRSRAGVTIEGGGRRWLLRRRGMTAAALERPGGERVGIFDGGHYGATGQVSAGADAVEVALLVLAAASELGGNAVQPDSLTSSVPFFG